MSEDEMLKCLIAFILGWLVSRQMGNGFSVNGADVNWCDLLGGNLKKQPFDRSLRMSKETLNTCPTPDWTGKCKMRWGQMYDPHWYETELSEEQKKILKDKNRFRCYLDCGPQTEHENTDCPQSPHSIVYSSSGFKMPSKIN